MPCLIAILVSLVVSGRKLTKHAEPFKLNLDFICEVLMEKKYVLKSKQAIESLAFPGFVSRMFEKSEVLASGAFSGLGFPAG